ncbi:phosphatidylinositol-3,5-bisphosphate 5-phosphatase [Cladochytrium tenue]|nr:phosphatidylinositol-3,5-bisphosphate 5-phosphatase [Cladochytrium tenue]
MPALCRFVLYETKSRFYVFGSNQNEDLYSVLKIDRTTPYELNVTEDVVKYTKSEAMDLLTMIDEGNKSTGGLQKVDSCFGIVGFVRFLEGYYMILITKRRPVALIGGHHIYHIDDTLMISIPGPGTKVERKPEEANYTYDLTQTLQHNMTRHRGSPFQPNDMFVWNHYLATLGFSSLASDWCLPIIYGFVDQSRISVFGRNIFITLIARRSRYYAGARFLKRVTLNDPFFSAAALHFDNMFERYGAPIIILNLIKSKEKSPRESVLLDGFGQSIAYLNQFLPPDMKMRYIAWDMARASKRVHGTKDVNRILGRRQNGVVRTNCIDCLDRTNAAQASGKEDGADPSPFTVRANPAAQRQLMIYSLNIGGVRRWLALSNRTTAQDRVASGGVDAADGVLSSESDMRLGRRPATGAAGGKAGDEPWWTTGALAVRLMEPQVPADEFREYKRYVAQFKPSSIVMVYATSSSSSSSTPASPPAPPSQAMSRTPSSRTGGAIASTTAAGDASARYLASHPDYTVFNAYASMAAAETPAASSVGARDVAVYWAYLGAGAAGSSGAGAGVAPASRHEMARYERHASVADVPLLAPGAVTVVPTPSRRRGEQSLRPKPLGAAF